MVLYGLIQFKFLMSLQRIHFASSFGLEEMELPIKININKDNMGSIFLISPRTMCRCEEDNNFNTLKRILNELAH